MDRTQKQELVGELKEKMSKAVSVVLADFSGLTVESVTGMRREFRANQCEYKVVKNRLMGLAIAGTAMEPMKPLLKGPTALVVSFEDPAVAAKIAVKYAKEQEEKFVIRGGFVDGNVLDTAGVSALAQLPGKDELRATLLATITAPATEMVRLLAAAPTNFLYLLSARERALGEQK